MVTFFSFFLEERSASFFGRKVRNSKEREHSGKKERKEYERGRIEREREREREIKIERGDAAPLYLNNIIKNAAIQRGGRHNSPKCGDIISLPVFPRVGIVFRFEATG